MCIDHACIRLHERLKFNVQSEVLDIGTTDHCAISISLSVNSYF